MPSARNQTGASSAEIGPSSKQGRPLTRGMRPLLYELFVPHHPTHRGADLLAGERSANEPSPRK